MPEYSWLLPSWVITKTVKISMMASVVAIASSGVGVLAIVETKFQLATTAVSAVKPLAKVSWTFIRAIPKHIQAGLKEFKGWISTVTLDVIMGGVKSALDFSKTSYTTVKKHAEETIPTAWNAHKGKVFGTISKSASSAWTAFKGDYENWPKKALDAIKGLFNHEWKQTGKTLVSIYTNLTKDAIKNGWSLIKNASGMGGAGSPGGSP